MRVTDAQVAADLALAEKATPGPWEMIFNRAPGRDFQTGLKGVMVPNSIRVVDSENRLLIRYAADPEQVLLAEDCQVIAAAGSRFADVLRDLTEAREALRAIDDLLTFEGRGYAPAPTKANEAREVARSELAVPNE